MTTVMEKTLIRWKMREIMARKKISATKMADALGCSRATISRLRNADEFPAMDHDRFNGICQFLECTPHDLIEYLPD